MLRDRRLLPSAGRHLRERDQKFRRRHIPVRRANTVRWLSRELPADRKSTRLNSSHPSISYAVFGLKKKKQIPKRSISGIQVINRQTGQAESEEELLFTGKNVFARLEDGPIFDTPYARRVPKDPLDR